LKNLKVCACFVAKARRNIAFVCAEYRASKLTARNSEITVYSILKKGRPR
jgi:hypothetical protein